MFIASGLGPYSGQAVHFKTAAPKDMEYAANRYLYEAHRHYKILDDHLAKNKYMVGDAYSIVDMANNTLNEVTNKLPLPTILAALSASSVGSISAPPSGPASEPGEDDAEPLVAGLPDGRWVEVATYPAELGSRLEGGTPSTIVVLRDVTKARDADAAREAFLGVLSHELRTPVTAIFGYAKVLQRPTRRDDQAELLSDIEVEADRLYRIVEDLLALSRVEGGLTIEGEPLLIQHLAGPVVASEARRWDRIDFSVDLRSVCRRSSASGPTWSRSCATSCRTRASTARTARRSWSPRPRRRRRSRSPSSIAGSGVRPDEAERLFDLYYRSPTTRPESGRRRDRAVRRPGTRPGDGRADLGEAATRWRLRVRVQPAALRRRHAGRQWIVGSFRTSSGSGKVGGLAGRAVA